MFQEVRDFSPTPLFFLHHHHHQPRKFQLSHPPLATTLAMSGFELLRKAEIAYSLEHNPDKAFDLYQKCIKRIMRHENVCASAFPGGRRPAGLPADAPSETIAMAFRNFSGFFRDPRMNYTECECVLPISTRRCTLSDVHILSCLTSYRARGIQVSCELPPEPRTRQRLFALRL